METQPTKQRIAGLDHTLEHIKIFNLVSTFYKSIKYRNCNDKRFLLIQYIKNLGKKEGYEINISYPIKFYNKNKSCVGSLAIAWMLNKKPYATFEVGGSIRKKSLMKLKFAKSINKYFIKYPRDNQTHLQTFDITEGDMLE